jgi:hypothetical protein
MRARSALVYLACGVDGHRGDVLMRSIYAIRLHEAREEHELVRFENFALLRRLGWWVPRR